MTISVKHPEIETFIHVKRDRKKVTGANVSIRVTDDFMRAVDEDSDFELQWPVDVPLEHAKVRRTVRARDIWEQIIDAAWDSAEPGILFWDRIIENSPADAYAKHGYASLSTNPCGEIALSPGDSCRLVIDVTKFVIDPFKSTSKFDFDQFTMIAKKAQRLMDDLVDLELEAIDKIINKVMSDPEDEKIKRIELDLWHRIKNAAINGRRTGLGLTGLGDALAMLGIVYGTKDSVDVTGQIYNSLALGAYRSTVQLAEERGSFPCYDHEIDSKHPFIKKIMDSDHDLARRWKKYGRRNIALTTTAPVGSVSMLTQTTSGIEPAYLLSYTRRKKLSPSDPSSKVDMIDALGDRWQEFTVYHHRFKHWMDVSGLSDVSKSPYHGATSNDVDWLMSVKVQAAAQNWICHSISKTCNLPKLATHELVSDVYLEAWKQGCKGFTVYRDGSRDGVLVAEAGVVFDLKKRLDGVSDVEIRKLLDIGKKHQTNIPAGHSEYLKEVENYLNLRNSAAESLTEALAAHEHAGENHARPRPKELQCEIHRVNVRGKDESGNIVPETYLVIVGLLEGKPYEIFCGLSEHVEVPRKYKSGVLVKNGKKAGVATYNLRIPVGDDDEAIVFKDVVNLFENPTYGAFTRILSLSLRHNIPIQYVVEQLQKDKHSDMQSFSRVIARVLKGYIADGTVSTGDKKCESCGAEGTLVYVEGCVSCNSCAWSKCG